MKNNNLELTDVNMKNRKYSNITVLKEEPRQKYISTDNSG